jgi:hypothetical protein
MLSNEPGFPRGLGKPQLFAMLRAAEREGLIEIEEFKNADHKTRSRWKLTAGGVAESNVQADSLSVTSGGDDDGLF